MLDKLGTTGVVGVVVLLAGLALVAWAANLVVAAGIAFVIAGLGLVAHGLVGTALAAMGMDGML